MADVVRAFLWCEPVEQPSDGLPKSLDGSLGGIAQQAFQFGEREFDRVEVRAVGRQVEERRPARLDGLLHAADLVRAEIVEHDDIARRKLWCQELPVT